MNLSRLYTYLKKINKVNKNCIKNGRDLIGNLLSDPVIRINVKRFYVMIHFRGRFEDADLDVRAAVPFGDPVFVHAVVCESDHGARAFCDEPASDIFV